MLYFIFDIYLHRLRRVQWVLSVGPKLMRVASFVKLLYSMESTQYCEYTEMINKFVHRSTRFYWQTNSVDRNFSFSFTI